MEDPDQKWKQEFISKLFPTDVNDVDIKEADRIKYKNTSEKLHRYRPIKNKSIKDLKNNVIWLSSAGKFNDPFECMNFVDVSKIIDIPEISQKIPQLYEELCQSAPEKFNKHNIKETDIPDLLKKNVNSL